MRIEVNQDIIEFSGRSVSDLMSEHAEKGNDGLVVIVNNSLIPKHQWEFVNVKESDSIFIVTPAEGG